MPVLDEQRRYYVHLTFNVTSFAENGICVRDNQVTFRASQKSWILWFTNGQRMQQSYGASTLETWGMLIHKGWQKIISSHGKSVIFWLVVTHLDW